MDFVTALVPLWAALLLIVLAGLAGWFWGRSAVAEVRQRAEVAEREARFLAGRAAVQQPATEALTRVLAGPRSIRPSDDLDRYIAERAEADATAIRTAVLSETVLDLDTAHDVYPSDDEPEDDREEPPSGEPVAAYHAAVLPRYDWSHTGWDPIVGTVAPPVAGGHLPWGRGLDLLRRVAGWPVVPVRWARWTLAGRSWRAAARAEAREVAEAVRLLGFDPEPAGAGPGRQPSVQPVVPPVSPCHRPVHVWRRKAISVAAVLGGQFPDGPAGRHQFGVAVGAIAQRQRRLLALPAGVR